MSSFLKLFDLEEGVAGRFTGYGPQTRWTRVFGGLVIAQALAASTRTITDGKRVHSMHAYFLLPGSPDAPIEYEVERLRDGKSFSTRQVHAIQNGAVIYSMMASYHVEEPGLDYAIKMPDVPGPDELESYARLRDKHFPESRRPMFEYFSDVAPLDIRPVDPNRHFSDLASTRGRDNQSLWFKTSDRLPDDDELHQAALAYASDMTLLDCTLVVHGRSVTDGTLMPASLDHTIWFHRRFRADEWLLYHQMSPSTHAARGLANGYIFDRSGLLVASVAQEGLIRPKRA